MEHGLVHLYCGDGKGKTTCAMGLALRALGRGRTVTVAQFLKSADSGERAALSALKGVTLLDVPPQMKFSSAMNQQERRQAAADFSRLLEQAAQAVRSGAGQLVILDEVCAAINAGLLPLSGVTAFLDGRPEDTEVVLTGRNPAPALMSRADYVTEMVKITHPYDSGVPARPGIEF